MMTILFIILFHDTYFEFGWKMYKKIRRSEWRCKETWNSKNIVVHVCMWNYILVYYRWYQTLMSLGKLTVLFTVRCVWFCLYVLYLVLCTIFIIVYLFDFFNCLDCLWAGAVHSIFRLLWLGVLCQYFDHDCGHCYSYS